MRLATCNGEVMCRSALRAAMFAPKVGDPGEQIQDPIVISDADMVECKIAQGMSQLHIGPEEAKEHRWFAWVIARDTSINVQHLETEIGETMRFGMSIEENAKRLARDGEVEQGVRLMTRLDIELTIFVKAGAVGQ